MRNFILLFSVFLGLNLTSNNLLSQVFSDPNKEFCDDSSESDEFSLEELGAEYCFKLRLANGANFKDVDCDLHVLLTIEGVETLLSISEDDFYSDPLNEANMIADICFDICEFQTGSGVTYFTANLDLVCVDDEGYTIIERLNSEYSSLLPDVFLPGEVSNSFETCRVYCPDDNFDEDFTTRAKKLTLAQSKTEMILYNTSGSMVKKINSSKMNDMINEVNNSSIPQGIYFVRYYSNEGVLHLDKIVKN